MTLALANYLLSLLWLLSSAWAVLNPAFVQGIARWFLDLPQNLQTMLSWVCVGLFSLQAVLGTVFFVKETKQALVLMVLIWAVVIPMFMVGMRNLKKHLSTVKN